MIRIYPLRLVSPSTAQAQRRDFDPELDVLLTDELEVSGNALKTHFSFLSEFEHAFE